MDFGINQQSIEQCNLLTLPLFIEVPSPSHECERLCICVLGVSTKPGQWAVMYLWIVFVHILSYRGFVFFRWIRAFDHDGEELRCHGRVII
jgi:hypothetical protein